MDDVSLKPESYVNVFVPTRTIFIDDQGSVINEVYSDNNDDNDGSSRNLPVVTIHLGLNEARLLDLLRCTASQFNEKITVRVAGGWVRDKILGYKDDINDVDIALDSSTGLEFATKIHQQKQQIPQMSSKIGVIAANPDQSKHLETATMKIFGIDLDFCNLRHESYSATSRIPTIQIGTPYQDAVRRDFTINSLFYNIHTQMVEDWTQTAIPDLLAIHSRKIILRTPLQDPIETFSDDPLRVLRSIRFAVRYNCIMDDKIKSACRNSIIHDKLQTKVSRERIGKELEGMLSGRNADPHTALSLITSLNLSGCVFTMPHHGYHVYGTIANQKYDNGYTDNQQQQQQHLIELQQMGWQQSNTLLQALPNVMASILQALSSVSSPTKMERVESPPSIDTRIIHLAVFLWPFSQLLCSKPSKQSTKVMTVVEYMMRESIKFNNNDTKNMKTVLEQVEPMIQIVQSFYDNNTQVTNAMRLQIGLLLRSTKELWKTSLCLAITIMTCKTNRLESNNKNNNNIIDWSLVAKKFINMVIHELRMDPFCWTMTPLLNGKDIIKLLNLPKGPFVGNMLQAQTEWMILNPNGTKDDCIVHLKQAWKTHSSKQDQQPAQKKTCTNDNRL